MIPPPNLPRVRGRNGVSFPACGGGLESDKGTSLRFTACEAFASFALTPSPSPTLWERGVGANGCSPAAVFSLARPAGEGDTEGEGKQASTPNAKQGRTVRAPLHEEPHPRVAGEGGEGLLLPTAQTQQARQTRTQRDHRRRLRHKACALQINRVSTRVEACACPAGNYAVRIGRVGLVDARKG
jgi:hypothetical protein